MRQPINETFGPSPKPRHQYQFVWLLAAAAVSATIWWIGWCVVSAVGGR